MNFKEALKECELYCDRVRPDPPREAIKVLCEVSQEWFDLAGALEEDDDIHDYVLDVLEDLGVISIYP